jgi:hypothetical protein
MIQKTGVLAQLEEEDICPITLDAFSDIESPIAINPFLISGMVSYPGANSNLIGIKPFSAESIRKLLLNKPLNQLDLTLRGRVELNTQTQEILSVRNRVRMNVDLGNTPRSISDLHIITTDRSDDTEIEYSVSRTPQVIETLRTTPLTPEHFFHVNIDTYRRICNSAGIIHPVFFPSLRSRSNVFSVLVFDLRNYIREILRTVSIPNPCTNSGNFKLSDFVPIRKVYLSARNSRIRSISRNAEFQEFKTTYDTMNTLVSLQQTTRLLIGDNIEIVPCSPKTFIEQNKETLDVVGIRVNLTNALIPFPFTDAQNSVIYNIISTLDVERNGLWTEEDLSPSISVIEFDPCVEYCIAKSMNLSYHIELEHRSRIELAVQLLYGWDPDRWHKYFLVMLSSCLNTPLQYCLRNPI